MLNNNFFVTTTISRDRVAFLLCSAMDGGSAYWATIESKDDYTAPPVTPDLTDVFKEECWNEKLFPYIHYPLLEGGEVRVKDKFTGKKYPLNLDAIDRGLKLMAEKTPKHFNDFITRYGDAVTGDVFLQFCLLGELVYG